MVDEHKRSKEKRMFPGSRPAVDDPWGREVPVKSRPVRSKEKRMFPGSRPAVDDPWGREVPVKSRPSKS